ncbi:MAG: GNAT family N-acetyltransferase [Bryobacteraceae bacterium]|nr:GNAT family N-acetyltransferase [Bryobacteraceae bacterium]
MPLQLGSQEQLDRLRHYLQAAGYTEKAILGRLGIERLSQAQHLFTELPPDDLLDALIYLFLLGQSVPRENLPGSDLLAELGLILDEGSRYSAEVSLYPTHGVYIASDRSRGRELADASSERVFSAVSANTEEFLSILPEAPCPAFLELCSGAAAAALIAASRYAAHAFAYDISARSHLFAEFNRRLNGLSNVTLARGDLYAPARTRTFDRIVAHPPYVPSLRADQVFRDGGADGEALTRRVIEGLPAHLPPGGRFYALALMARYQHTPIEDRVRAWLREAQTQFDVAVITRAELNPPAVILDNWSPRHAQEGDLARWQTALRSLRIESFSYVMVVVERHAAQRRPATVARTSMADRFVPRPVEQALAASQLLAAGNWCHLNVRAHPDTLVVTRAPLRQTAPALVEYTSQSPFLVSCRGTAETAGILRTGQGSPEELARLLSDGLLTFAPTVIEAREEHLETVATLFREYAGAVDEPRCFPSFEAELSSLPAGYLHLLLAVDATGPLGVAALRPFSQQAGEMKRLYVRPSARGSRVGELLAETIIALARRHGFERLLLDTLPGMDAARGLYRKLGFREIPPYRPNAFPGAIHMELRLIRSEAEAAFESGRDNAASGRLAEAFAAFERCVQLNPDHAAACKELARLSRLANEVRAFTNWCHEAIRLAPEDPEPHSMLAEALAAAGRLDEAAAEEIIARRLAERRDLPVDVR